jgi:hypothetical protein
MSVSSTMSTEKGAAAAAPTPFASIDVGGGEIFVIVAFDNFVGRINSPKSVALIDLDIALVRSMIFARSPSSSASSREEEEEEEEREGDGEELLSYESESESESESVSSSSSPSSPS